MMRKHSVFSRKKDLPLATALLTAATLTLAACAVPFTSDTATEPAQAQCPQSGQWVIAGQQGTFSMRDVLDQVDDNTVVLLGERHDRMRDHYWQLHIIAGLHGRFDQLAVGYEMFARDQQPVLTDWVAGKLTRDEFHRASDWDERWGLSFDLYEPLLAFNQLQQVPAFALNVEPELVNRIGREGWGAVPAHERHGIGPGAEPEADYQAYLTEVAGRHGHLEPTEEDVEQFIRAQGVWDRAMAEGLSEMLDQGYGPVVGIVGRGHVFNGHGIPYQLSDLGAQSVMVLLPYRAGEDCLGPDGRLADALYGMPERQQEEGDD